MNFFLNLSTETAGTLQLLTGGNAQRRQSLLKFTGILQLLSYLTGKACYRLALRPPVGPLHISELTFRLLEPLGVFFRLQE